MAALLGIDHNKKEALLIMFGPIWKKRFWPLDGQEGRPTLADCIEKALLKNTVKSNEDLVNYVENHLKVVSRRCERVGQKVRRE